MYLSKVKVTPMSYLSYHLYYVILVRNLLDMPWISSRIDLDMYVPFILKCNYIEPGPVDIKKITSQYDNSVHYILILRP